MGNLHEILAWAIPSIIAAAVALGGVAVSWGNLKGLISRLSAEVTEYKTHLSDEVRCVKEQLNVEIIYIKGQINPDNRENRFITRGECKQQQIQLATVLGQKFDELKTVLNRQIEIQSMADERRDQSIQAALTAQNILSNRMCELSAQVKILMEDFFNEHDIQKK